MGGGKELGPLRGSAVPGRGWRGGWWEGRPRCEPRPCSSPSRARSASSSSSTRSSASFVLELPFVGAMWWLGEGRGARCSPAPAVKWKGMEPGSPPGPRLFLLLGPFLKEGEDGGSWVLVEGVGCLQLGGGRTGEPRRWCKHEHALCNASKNNNPRLEGSRGSPKYFWRE